MKHNQQFRFPAAVRAFRVAAGMQQQVLADKVGMGAAALCALEKGRRPVPDGARVAALGQALSLGRSDLVVRERWARHDRLVAYLIREGLDEAVPLLSQALQCAWHASSRQRATLCTELRLQAEALERAVALETGKDQEGGVM